MPSMLSIQATAEPQDLCGQLLCRPKLVQGGPTLPPMVSGAGHHAGAHTGPPSCLHLQQPTAENVRIDLFPSLSM